MYIGDNEDPRSLFNEAFDNAIDELLNGANRVEIEVDTKENRYIIRDYGRGIPLGRVNTPEGEEEILKVLTSRAGSGAKFNNSAFKFRSGLNGVGLVVLAALSSSLAVRTIREVRGKRRLEEIRYRSGEQVDYREAETNPEVGVLVSFQVDDSSIFRQKRIPLSYIEERIRVAKICLKDKDISLRIDGVKKEFKSENLISLIKHKPKEIYDTQRLEVKIKTQELLSLEWRITGDAEVSQLGYTNLLPNKLGGIHCELAMKWLKEELLKEFDSKKELRANDLKGIDLVISVMIEDPAFNSQTKDYLSSDCASKILEFEEKARREIRKKIRESKDLYRLVYERAIEAKRKLAELKATKGLQKLLNINSTTLAEKGLRAVSGVSKLVDCSHAKVKNTELFLVEGDSAASPLISCRDATRHAILPLRGKVMNITNKSIKDSLANNEILDIANAIGSGVGESCNPDLCRYERIIICSDSDPDGLNIAALLLGVALKLFYPLVEAGKFYIADSSLYGYYSREEFFPLKKLEDLPPGVKYKRFKGLGSLNPKELKSMLLDPAKRSLIRITNGGSEEAIRVIRDSSEKKGLLIEEGLIKSLRD